MIKRTRPFQFQRVYEMAALVDASVDNEESLIELDWASPDVPLTAVRFSKISLLHQDIYAMIAVEHDRDYRKNADLYGAEQIVAVEARAASGVVD